MSFKMYPITINPSNETLKVLKVSYTFSVIDGSVRPTVHSPMHITKEKLLEMWFSTELSLNSSILNSLRKTVI